MDYDLELDRLIYNMEKLEKSVSIKRRKLQQDCDILSGLLKPWKIEMIKPEGPAEVPTECLSSPVEPTAKEDQELKENLDKIDLILAKVHAVRGGVIDEEIRDACQMERMKMDDKVKKPKKTLETRKKNQPESINPKPTVKSNHTKQIYNTTYKRSYQPPRAKSSAVGNRSSAVDSRSSATSSKLSCSSSRLYGVSKRRSTRPAIEKQENHSTKSASIDCGMTGKVENINAGLLKPVGATSGKAGNTASQVASIPQQSITEQPLFDLMKNGSSLKVSKNLAVFIKRRDRLQKLTSGSAEIMLQLPLALELYYSELETTSAFS